MCCNNILKFLESFNAKSEKSEIELDEGIKYLESYWKG